MWFLVAGAALALFLFSKRSGLPPYLMLDEDGDVVFNEDLPGGRTVHQALLTYGRKSEGTLSDGTMWIKGTRDTGKPAGDSGYASNIYARALQLGGPVKAQLRWIVIRRSDIEAIANGNAPAEVELMIVDPTFAHETRMLVAGQTWIYYG